MTTPASALISVKDLAAIIDQPHVRIVDATYGQPPAASVIGKAVHFDIDLIADTAAPQAHTIPTAATFADEVGKLGIGNDDLVIVYDQTGMAFAAARVWWMFRLFGHDNVRVLDGGLPAWRAAGLPLSAQQTTAPQQVRFNATFRPHLFKKRADMLANITAQDFKVLDARDPRRFSGSIPEPRPGMASGHIPGSHNAFFGSLIDPDSGRLHTADALRQHFDSEDIPTEGAIACTCGSGVTACVVALALYEVGNHDAAIYGGSWSEWATTPNMPVAKDEE